MASSQELFNLVKSLTKNEKRNFQIFSGLSKSSETNYLKIFELFDSMESYDKELINKKLKGEKFLQSLHVTENYLFQRIMESLRLFYESKNVDAKIYNHLFEAQLLEKKGFYLLSLELLQKAEKIAIRYHKYLAVMEIAPKKASIVMSTETKNLSERIENIFITATEYLNKYQEELKYRQEHASMVLMFRKWRTIRNSEVLTEMTQRIGQILADSAPKEDNFYASWYYYALTYTYYYTLQDYPKALVAQTKVIEVWDNAPDIISANQQAYIAQLSNLIVCCISCKDYHAVENALLKLEKLQPTSNDEAGELFQNLYFLKQYYLLNLQDFKAAVELVPEIEKGLLQYSAKINPSRKLSFLYNNTVALFLTENYLAASDWLQKILQLTRTDEQRKDIQNFSRILQLAIFYKLESNEVLEYLFRSVYRNKKHLDEMLDFEKVVLKCFRLIISTVPGSIEERQIFQQMKEDMEKLDEKNKKTIGFEEFYIWVQTQIEGKVA
jgi:hypothetical protein